MQAPRHFVRDRDAPSRQTEHDYVLAPGILFKLFREEPAGLHSV